MIKGGFTFPYADQFVTRCENLNKELGFYSLKQSYERKDGNIQPGFFFCHFSFFSDIMIESR